MKKILFASMFLLSFSSHACTAFCLEKSKDTITAKSYDWSFPDGALYINYRGLKKKAILTDIFKSGVAWTSKYGSVTISQAGIEFPYTGMNEEGLVVEILQMIGSTYEPYDSNHKYINESQVLQYILDTSANLDEAVENLNKVRIFKEQEGVHYLFCDSMRQCAGIMVDKGQYIISRNRDYPISVMTNSIYRTAFGNGSGPQLKENLTDLSDIRLEKERSLKRFEMANAISKSQLDSSKPEVDWAFDELKKVAVNISEKTHEISQWHVVHNQTQKRMYFRLVRDMDKKAPVEIDLKKMDFSCKPKKYFADVFKASDGFIEMTSENHNELLKRSARDLSWIERLLVVHFHEFFTDCENT